MGLLRRRREDYDQADVARVVKRTMATIDELVLSGQVKPAHRADRIIAESLTRMRARGRGWSERKIQRRIAWRLRARRAWEWGKRWIPFRPTGGMLVDAGNLIQAIVEEVQKQILEEA